MCKLNSEIVSPDWGQEVSGINQYFTDLSEAAYVTLSDYSQGRDSIDA